MVKDLKMNSMDYLNVAVIAQETALQMIKRLEGINLKPARILEVGAARGLGESLLRERYPNAVYLSMDTHDSLLQHTKPNNESIHRIEGDSETLPFASASIDFIFANLVLPWVTDYQKIFKEWRRVLSRDGLILFSCLGPDTLREWHDFLANDFLPELIDMHDVGDALVKAKFSDPVMDVDYVTLTYRDIQKLFYELQMTKMISVNDYQPLYAQAEVKMKSSDVYSTAYEIIYGHAWGPNAEVDYVADESGVVKIPLSHLRRRK